MTPPHFCLLIAKVDQLDMSKTGIAICFTEEQTKYVYKKVEQGSEINTETMRQEIDQEKLTEIKTGKEDEINPYQKVMLNNVYTDEIKTMQMEFWSLLSDNVKYIEYDDKSAHSLDVETLDYRQHREL